MGQRSERRQFSAKGSPKRAAFVICGSAMADKISHSEISASGGRSRSEAKLEAVRNNLEKAKAALAQKRAARESVDKSDDNCERPVNDYPAGPRLIL